MSNFPVTILNRRKSSSTQNEDGPNFLMENMKRKTGIGRRFGGKMKSLWAIENNTPELAISYKWKSKKSNKNVYNVFIWRLRQLFESESIKISVPSHQIILIQSLHPMSDSYDCFFMDVVHTPFAVIPSCFKIAIVFAYVSSMHW